MVDVISVKKTEPYRFPRFLGPVLLIKQVRCHINGGVYGIAKRCDDSNDLNRFDHLDIGDDRSESYPCIQPFLPEQLVAQDKQAEIDKHKQHAP